MEVARPSLPDGVYGAELARRVDAAAGVLRAWLAQVPALVNPRIGMVLGSGLGGVADLLDPEPRLSLDYAEIPGIPCSGVAGHAGRLIAGTASGRAVLIQSGRAHPYEGWSQRETTVLLRACLSLGIETLVLTNAAGGIHPELEPGDVMSIADSLNLSGDNPLRGPNLDDYGPRFVPMTDAWDPGLRRAAHAAAGRAGVTLRDGVYCMLSGPSFETRAELRMLRTLGVDAVGMSTVHELLVARHHGARVVGFSVITNKATPEMVGEVTHEEVLIMGPMGAARLTSILRQLLPELG
ncbi:MAG TPA: purine-nucleoside phosphorylase [Candidatus Limnocylindria bacterium]|nr:purine-nucleoside phosphorylase [Candidatus Limnocylindria bacterium]